MEPFNFDKLPEVVRQLFEKVEKLESLLENLQPCHATVHEFLDVREAAEFLKITVSALYTKVSRKEIPVNKPGKRLYFKRSELQDWINLGRQKTTAEVYVTDNIARKPSSQTRFHKLDKF